MSTTSPTPLSVHPRGVVHEPGGIVLLDPGDDALRVELSPALVERDPHHDRRMVAQRGDHAMQLGLELRLGGRRPVLRARHVLPHEHADAVGQVVPARRFHLHVLADHVEAQALGHDDVVAHGGFGGRRVQSIGPPALVERTVLEERLVVEEEAPVAVGGGADGDLPHPEVAADGVARGEGDAELVEVRIVGRPEVCVAHPEHDRLTHGRRAHCDLGAAGEHAHADGRAGGRARDVGLHGDGSGVDVGGGEHARDVRAGHRLQPHRLPDAGDGAVPDGVRVQHLLSARLLTAVGGIPDAHDELLRTIAVHGVGDVEGEGVVAAAMLADPGTVHPDGGVPVHRAEMQQQPAFARDRGRREAAVVPEAL